MRKSILMAIAFAALSLPVQAQVYKWVDQNGKVQYSDQPPPSSAAKAAPQTLTIAPSGDTVAPAGKAPKGKAKDSDKNKSEAAEKQKKEDEKTKLAEQKQEACKQARGNLAALQSGGRVSRFDENGNKYFLDDAQRESETAKLQQSITESCK